MQVVSLAGGPNLTGPSFWALRGCLIGGSPPVPAAGPLGFSFSRGLDGDASGNAGGAGTAGVGPTSMLQIPNGGNAGHILNGQHFTLVVAGKSVTWQLTETPATTTDIGISNGDSASVVAGKLVTAFETSFTASGAYGFAFGIVVANALTANSDGSVNVQFLAVDSALTGAMHLGPVDVHLTVIVADALSLGAWGYKLLRNAGHTFIYQGLGETSAPAGVDMTKLTIVGWGLCPGKRWFGMPRAANGLYILAPG